MSTPPVEVYCQSLTENPNSVVVETEVYPHGYPNDDPYYINTRWVKKSGDVAFDVVDFGGKGDPGEPMLNGAAVRASAEEIEDQLNVNNVDDSSSHPDPDVGWVRVDDNGNKI